MEDDDMDSLFEGMTLFTPSHLSAPPPPSHPLDPPPPPAAAPAEPAVSSSQSSEPLDENLFSDLTLVTPLSAENGHQEPPLSSPAPAEFPVPAGNSVKARDVAPPSAVARQVSRKKKRAAGLRIGYGRHEIDHDPPSPSASPPPSVPVDAASATSSDARSKQDALSADSISSQSERTEPDGAVSTVTVPQIDRDEPPSPPPPVPAETKSEPESIDSVAGSESAPDGIGESIDAKFDRIKVEISEKLEQARELVAALSAVKKEAIRKRRKAAERVNSASTKLKELERSLEEACETEDFEMAERLSESIAVADKERAALADALRDAESECDGVDEQMQQVLEAQIAAEEECVSLLESFSMVTSALSD